MNQKRHARTEIVDNPCRLRWTQIYAAMFIGIGVGGVWGTKLGHDDVQRGARPISCGPTRPAVAAGASRREESDDDDSRANYHSSVVPRRRACPLLRSACVASSRGLYAAKTENRLSTFSRITVGTPL